MSDSTPIDTEFLHFMKYLAEDYDKSLKDVKRMTTYHEALTEEVAVLKQEQREKTDFYEAMIQELSKLKEAETCDDSKRHQDVEARGADPLSSGCEDEITSSSEDDGKKVNQDGFEVTQSFSVSSTSSSNENESMSQDDLYLDFALYPPAPPPSPEAMVMDEIDDETKEVAEEIEAEMGSLKVQEKRKDAEEIKGESNGAGGHESGGHFIFQGSSQNVWSPTSTGPEKRYQNQWFPNAGYHPYSHGGQYRPSHLNNFAPGNYQQFPAPRNITRYFGPGPNGMNPPHQAFFSRGGRSWNITYYPTKQSSSAVSSTSIPSSSASSAETMDPVKTVELPFNSTDNLPSSTTPSASGYTFVNNPDEIILDSDDDD